MIKENIAKIKGSTPKDVIIVAATKKRTTDEIKEAIKAGIDVIGENYVKEAEEKYKTLQGLTEIHCIGHLQTNKVKKAVEIFDMIQTVDSIKIAEEINKRTQKEMPILIEVNIGEEKNKTGCLPDKLNDLITGISELKNIKIKGLMTMAPFFQDPEQTRPYFKKMKQLFDNYNFDILSMGMSHSYKVAMEEGANMVRVGTSIFGKR